MDYFNIKACVGFLLLFFSAFKALVHTHMNAKKTKQNICRISHSLFLPGFHFFFFHRIL